MNLIHTELCIKDGKNVIYYNKDLSQCYKNLKQNFTCVYLDEPVPVKSRLINAILAISKDQTPALSRFTIIELIKILVTELENRRLIIFFNHFDRLTPRSAHVYQQLNSYKNIVFVCNFNQDITPDLYPFFKTFELMNKEEYRLASGENEINITYAAYALISGTCFFIYLKAASYMLIATMLIGGVWFALIIYRTLIYAGGRI